MNNGICDTFVLFLITIFLTWSFDSNNFKIFLIAFGSLPGSIPVYAHHEGHSIGVTIVLMLWTMPGQKTNIMSSHCSWCMALCTNPKLFLATLSGTVDVSIGCDICRRILDKMIVLWNPFVPTQRWQVLFAHIFGHYPQMDQQRWEYRNKNLWTGQH